MKILQLVTVACVCAVASACSGFTSIKEVRELPAQNVTIVKAPLNLAHERVVTMSRQCFSFGANRLIIDEPLRDGSGEVTVMMGKISGGSYILLDNSFVELDADNTELSQRWISGPWGKTALLVAQWANGSSTECP